MNDDESTGAWLTIVEAARTLRTSKAAIRSRIQRKTIRIRPGKASNDGLIRVWVSHADVTPDSTADDSSMYNSVVAPDSPSEIYRRVIDLEILVAKLEAEKEAALSRIADRDQEIARVRADAAQRVDELKDAHNREVARLEAALNEARKTWFDRLLGR